MHALEFYDIVMGSLRHLCGLCHEGGGTLAYATVPGIFDIW